MGSEPVGKPSKTDASQQDQLFMINFSKVMVGVGAIFAICIIAAVIIGRASPTRDDATVREQVAARLAPPLKVVTDPSQLVVAAVATERAPLTGEQVVQRVCAGCHTAGVLNAPKTGDTAAWQARLAQGFEVLVKHSIEGFNQMPARGGDRSLSDDEIRASVKTLLEQSGITL